MVPKFSINLGDIAAIVCSDPPKRLEVQLTINLINLILPRHLPRSEIFGFH